MRSSRSAPIDHGDSFVQSHTLNRCHHEIIHAIAVHVSQSGDSPDGTQL